MSSVPLLTAWVRVETLLTASWAPSHVRPDDQTVQPSGASPSRKKLQASPQKATVNVDAGCSVGQQPKGASLFEGGEGLEVCGVAVVAKGYCEHGV